VRGIDVVWLVVAFTRFLFVSIVCDFMLTVCVVVWPNSNAPGLHAFLYYLSTPPTFVLFTNKTRDHHYGATVRSAVATVLAALQNCWRTVSRSASARRLPILIAQQKQPTHSVNAPTALHKTMLMSMSMARDAG
jgi:hypothetical protein